jgi:small subunit ribosomal protein S4
MSKRLSAKFKVDRRLGCNLWGKAKSPVNNRNYAPGQHGMNRKKPTDYGIQLLAKQKLRGYYGNIQEKQFRRIYEKAMKMRGDTSENIIGLLERRLDAVVYRMKLAPSVFAARQLINHGHIKVNGKTLNIGSYSVSEGDEIELASDMKQNTIVLSAIQSSERDVPSYIEMDNATMKGRFLNVPKLSDVPYPVMMEPNLVVEFYSR